jgi:hypothetical protein
MWRSFCLAYDVPGFVYIHTFRLHFIHPISAHGLLDMKHVIISLISISMTDTDKKHKQQYHSTTSHTVQALQYNIKMQKIYESIKVKGKK